MDALARTLRRDEELVTLTRRAFDVLLYLVQNPGRVLSRDELLKNVWPDTFVDENSLAQSVSALRRALEEKPGDNSYIVTLPGRGYQFVSPVKVLTPEDITTALEVAAVAEPHSVGVVLQRETIQTSITTQERQLARLPAPGRRWARLALGALTIVGALTVSFFLRPAPMPRVSRAIRLTRSGRVEPSGRVVTDGPRLYFTERLGGTWGLAQVPEQGGAPLPISVPVDNIALYDIDPSRALLLVGSQSPSDDFDDPLWIIPTIGGSPHRVGDAFAGDAAWAPDGRSLAYSRKAEIFLSDSDGQRPHKIFSAPGTVFSPSWSPDGQRLSFSVRDQVNGTVAIWEIGRDGRDPHPLPLGWSKPRSIWNEGECCGVWTPDGAYFVFRSVRDNVQSFWMVRGRSNWFHSRMAPVQIYTSPERLGEPRFSPDGRRILFVDYQERRELMSYDFSRKIFVPYLGGIPARHLSFSPDGQWVAYENEADRTLWRSRIDGSQALQLTFPPLEVLQSTWSPDGKQMIFSASENLYVIPAQGGNPTLLTRGIEPSWSPDGRFVLFAASSTDATGWHPSIYQLDMATHDVKLIPGSLEFEGPQWSPDGKYIAAADRKEQKLKLFDCDRQEWAVLADGLPYGWGIRWSADSKYVYYQHHTGEEQPILRVRLSDHAVEQITSSQQILRADVLSYTMTGLAPDGSPLASLVRRNSDIYALQLELP